MKVDKKKLTKFCTGLLKTKKNLSSKELAGEIAKFLESNPSCIGTHKHSKPLRFTYSTVGYGIFSLLGEKYRRGRIEVFDDESSSGYQIHEGAYCIPHQAAAAFEDFIDALSTDLPIQINLGSTSWCEEECVKSLGLNSADDLHNPEKIEQFRLQNQDAYAQSKGYTNWQNYMESIAKEKKDTKE